MTQENKQIEEGLRLEKFVKSLNIKGNKFAKEVGVSQALVSATMSGDKPITRTFVNKITRRYPDFQESWLWTGIGPMMLDKSNLVETTQNDDPDMVKEGGNGYEQDPLAGLRSIIARVEELERWRAEVESEKNKI